MKCSLRRRKCIVANLETHSNPFSDDVLRVALSRVLRRWDIPLRLCFYYPADTYLTLLSGEPRLTLVDEINCRGLFDGDNPRESVVIYSANDY